MKPYVVIFSSSGSYVIAQGIQEHLKDLFTVHLWKGEFFGENKTTPLWTFFKKLFHYDYAILVLSDDNIVVDKKASGTEQWIPKDNVIFELGATMARLGPQKTIMVVPDKPKIHLPGYFDDVKPFVFEYKNQENYAAGENIAATAEAAAKIKAILESATFETFHSELPAQGLAYAYLQNFLFPVLKSKDQQVLNINGQELLWKPESGITVTIVIPDEIMGRNKANVFFEDQKGLYKTYLRLTDGRDIGIYVLQRQSEGEPLHVLDIPTTLLTAEDIIERIEKFWREKDNTKVLEKDKEFSDALKQREIINFRRTLDEMLKPNRTNTYIISSNELAGHIEKLGKG